MKSVASKGEFERIRDQLIVSSVEGNLKSCGDMVDLLACSINVLRSSDKQSTYQAKVVSFVDGIDGCIAILNAARDALRQMSEGR